MYEAIEAKFLIWQLLLDLLFKDAILTLYHAVYLIKRIYIAHSAPMSIICISCYVQAVVLYLLFKIQATSHEHNDFA